MDKLILSFCNCVARIRSRGRRFQKVLKDVSSHVCFYKISLPFYNFFFIFLRKWTASSTWE